MVQLSRRKQPEISNNEIKYKSRENKLMVNEIFTALDNQIGIISFR